MTEATHQKTGTAVGRFALPGVSGITRILWGEDWFVNIIKGPSLQKVKRRARCGRAMRFTLASATAINLEQVIRNLTGQGLPINEKTWPQLFEDIFEIDVSLNEASLLEIDGGILHRGIASFPALNIENFPFFHYKFPVDFEGIYDPDAPGIKGRLHILRHDPWKK